MVFGGDGVIGILRTGGRATFGTRPRTGNSRAIADMSWVIVDPAILPRPGRLEPFVNPERQFLYVADLKDQITNWWTGVLQQWEVTYLTDSIRRGALLDLTLPLTPRTRPPRNKDIPMDPTDLDDDDDSQPEVRTSFNSLD